MQALDTLHGTAALVTGASRGLGRALAIALGRAGARVVLVARGADALSAARDEVAATGADAHAITADVGDADAAVEVVRRATALVGPLDLVINNASVLGPTPLAPLLDTDAGDLERVLAVNLVGPFVISKHAAASMALRGRGTIVNISSDAAVAAYPTWGSYSVSKAALDHLTRIWAAELSDSGVTVLSIDPGEMDTVMHAAAIPEADPATLSAPDDVAQAILELLTQPKEPSQTRFAADALMAVTA